MAIGEHCGLARHLVTGRWTIAFACFCIMATTGASQMFKFYANIIETRLGYNQSTLSTMISFKDIGNSVGIFSGLIAEIAPNWFVLLSGSLTNFLGYFMMWLAVTGRIAKPQLWMMCLYLFMAANSQNFANTASLVTCVKNFPESRSIILGLLKGYAGLSSSLLTQIYLATYADDSAALILFIALLPAIISLLFMYTIREKEVKGSQAHDTKVFYYFLSLSAALALFLMAMSLTQQWVKFSNKAYAASATVSTILMLLPAVVAIKKDVSIWRQTKEHPSEIMIGKLQPDELQKNPSKKRDEEPKKSFLADVFNKPPRGENFTIMQAVFSIDMLIIFICSFVGQGSCLTAIGNLSKIGEALLYEPKTVKTFASMITIWNYSGRVFSGFISEILLSKYKVPRPVLLSAVLFLLSIGLILIAFPFTGSIYVASLIIGFTYGAQLPLILAIISEIFGLKHFSTLFNFGQLASPIGSYVFNKELTGRLYDREAKKMVGFSPNNMVCKGMQCFSLSFKILSLAALLAAIISVILVVRTREVYNGDIYKKYRGETYMKFDEEEKKKETTSAK